MPKAKNQPWVSHSNHLALPLGGMPVSWRNTMLHAHSCLFHPVVCARQAVKMHELLHSQTPSWFCLVSRLFEAGQDELSGTELLIQRQEELHRLQARLSRASVYPGEDPRASILDLAEPLHSSPLEAGLHPRKSKVMQCIWIQTEFRLYRLKCWWQKMKYDKVDSDIFTDMCHSHYKF